MTLSEAAIISALLTSTALPTTNTMGRKRSRGSSGAKASGATIDKIDSYEDTIERGGVDDCELPWSLLAILRPS